MDEHRRRVRQRLEQRGFREAGVEVVAHLRLIVSISFGRLQGYIAAD
jgi:hypothetical protein